MFQNRLIAFLMLILATGSDCGGHAHSGHSAISGGGGGDAHFEHTLYLQHTQETVSV